MSNASFEASDPKLVESETRFRTMADHAPVLLWMAGTDGECNFFNEGWLRFTGRTQEEEYGVGWAEGIHFEDYQRCMTTYLDSFVVRKAFTMEYRLRRADGEYRWIYDQGVPRFLADGTFAGFIGSCIDITEQKNAQETLARLNQKLLRTNLDLQQFAYAASHDLRSPLRAIDSLSQWLMEDLNEVLVGDRREQMNLLRARVRRMDHLLTDIRDYVRAGKVEPDIERCDVGVLLAEVVDLVILPRGFRVEVASPMPVIESARLSLQRVFLNLLENAIKHHDRSEGLISITVADAKDPRCVEFRVSDDGPGIAPRFHQKVFQMFQTLKPRDAVEGSGMGLAIAKMLVEAAGGVLVLESDGRGATFKFTWPKHRARRMDWNERG